MNNKTCHCADNEGLFIPNRQLSALVAFLFLLFFAVFMTGYFLGKKKVVEQFTQEIRQDAFADQVYTNVVSAHTHDESSSLHDSLVMHREEAPVTLPSINQDFTELSVENNNEPIAHERYYAQLIGFGTEKAAHLFVKKLATKGIETEMKKRASKTAKGQISYWYQVVTLPFTDKNELSVLVNKLAKEENIKDACIERYLV